jgi:branched-chain amino acid transport system permease protein
MTGWACLAIFVVQMLKPLLAGKLPKVNLPACRR